MKRTTHTNHATTADGERARVTYVRRLDQVEQLTAEQRDRRDDRAYWLDQLEVVSHQPSHA